MKIVVLAGGLSTERDVSLSSGCQIYKALKSKGHSVILLDIFMGFDGDVAMWARVVGNEHRVMGIGGGVVGVDFFYRHKGA